MLDAAPHKMLPNAKMNNAPSMTGRRPKTYGGLGEAFRKIGYRLQMRHTSAKPPLIGRNAVEDKAYAEPTQTN